LDVLIEQTRHSGRYLREFGPKRKGSLPVLFRGRERGERGRVRGIIH
jgi:hypothetical protein